MTVLVLAIEKNFWQDVLLKMQSDGINISHAVVHYRYPHVDNRFFDEFKGELIDGKNFYRVPDVRKELEKYNAPLSAKIINDMREFERDFNILTDRFSYFPKSYKYRKQLFRHSLRFWFGFFAANKIEKVFASCSPHNMSDFVAFNVARYLGIPTYQVCHTMINDCVLLRKHYSDVEKMPEKYNKITSEKEITAKIPEYLHAAALQKSNILEFVTSRNDASIGAKNLNKTEMEPKIDFSRLRKRWHRVFFRSPRFKGVLALNGVYPPIVRRSLRVKDRHQQKKQKEISEIVSVRPNLTEKYIYFAMHMQPERTSTPEAGLFEDHLLAIEILARSLPKGWKLYVKENPRQFDRRINSLKWKHFRDQSDYEDILKLPNTSIITQDVATKELIDNAQIVATLSGSVGWEAIQAGKPCFVFASAWYVSCPSCYLISDVNDAENSIKKAVKKTKKEVRLDVLRYLAFMKDKLFIGNMGEEEDLSVAKVPYDSLIDETSKKLVKVLK